MPVVLLIAGLVIVAAVILVAAGRGGELPVERSDYAPLDLGPVSATDVALMRPPANAWGYNIQATDEAMAQIAESIRERDVRIVALEQLVTDLSKEPAPPALPSPYVGSRRRALPEGARPGAGDRALAAGQQAAAEQPDEEPASSADTTWSAETAWSREAAQPAEPAWPDSPTRPDLPAWPGEAAGETAQPEAAPAPAGTDPPPAEDHAVPQAEDHAVPPERSHD